MNRNLKILEFLKDIKFDKINFLNAIDPSVTLSEQSRDFLWGEYADSLNLLTFYISISNNNYKYSDQVKDNLNRHLEGWIREYYQN